MSEVIQRNAQEVLDIAASKGLVVFFPDPYELQIDLDKGQKVDITVLKVLAQNGFDVVSTLTTKSQGGNKHVYYRLNKRLDPMQRICFQACLGSDTVREVLSIIRLIVGSEAPTALFETPEQAKLVDNWTNQCISAPVADNDVL